MKPFTEDQREAIQYQLKQFESDVPEEIHSDVETFVDKMCIWAGKNTEKMEESRSGFKEEVLRALEGMKRVTAFGAVDGITMGENGRYNDVIQDAIETIKSL